MRIAAVPTRLVEEIALIGPPEKIRDELAAWEESVVTTMLVQGRLSPCARSRMCCRADR